MKTKHKSGFSLIEIMVAALLLAFLAVGGAAVLYQTGGGVRVQGNKRIAMEHVRSELEELSEVDYFELRARAIAANPEVLVWNESHYGVPFSVTVTNRFISTGGVLYDVSSGTLDNEYLELSVRIQSREDVIVMNVIKVLL